MKKSISLLILLFTTTFFAFAQNATIAKLKYEEAEEAYSANDYSLALSKLNEVEAMLKSTNPKIMYLKICSQSKIIEANPYNDFKLIDNARSLSTKYLNDYETFPGNEEKYKDIYKISEKLKSYPSTSQKFDEESVKKKMLTESGFKFSDKTYEMYTINGQNGECKVESFVGSELSSDSYAHTTLKINQSEYWGGECKSGYLNGLVLMTVYGDKKLEKENILAYFVDGRITYPFLNTHVDNSDQLFIGIQAADESFGCLAAGSEYNWNKVDERQKCVDMKEIYGEQIFSLDFVSSFKHGNIDLKELEKRFKYFITTGRKLTRE